MSHLNDPTSWSVGDDTGVIFMSPGSGFMVNGRKFESLTAAIDFVAGDDMQPLYDLAKEAKDGNHP